MPKVKVCGMRNAENIALIEALYPDYMGFIFYPQSKRFVGADFDTKTTQNIDGAVKKIGVFVNMPIDEAIQIVNRYKLDGVQLHGGEDVVYLKTLKQKLLTGTLIIKVFQVDEAFNFEDCKVFRDVCDYFLFDTKTKEYGGSGKSFDWKILENYVIDKPFFLSGGIKLEDAESIVKLKETIPQLYAIDINSMFEIAPGIKNTSLVKDFMDRTSNI